MSTQQSQDQQQGTVGKWVDFLKEPKNAAIIGGIALASIAGYVYFSKKEQPKTPEPVLKEVVVVKQPKVADEVVIVGDGGLTANELPPLIEDPVYEVTDSEAERQAIIVKIIEEGDLLLEGGDFSGALQCYATAVKLGCVDFNLLYKIQFCQNTLDPNPKEETELERLSNEGMMALAVGENQKAYDAFKRCVDLEPQNGQLRYFIGVTASNLEKFQEAHDQLEQAGFLEPQLLDDGNYNYALGMTLIGMKRYDDGIEYLRICRVKPGVYTLEDIESDIELAHAKKQESK
ncbi:protein methyltransferase FrzF [Acrasis kona]|uniref:Protein methyltransferase FrzF n=1 Tax=Acrasis kona TaxID=1008807 RepID=A0AAW2YLS2_9EUKA